MPKRILFIGHSAGYTGAPVILLRLAEWFKKNNDTQLQILLRADGPLVTAYEAVAPLAVYQKLKKNNIRNRYLSFFLNSIIFGRKLSVSKLKKLYPPGSIDIVFSNTVTNGEILHKLAYLNCPVISRVAEMNYWVNKMGNENFTLTKKYTSHFIAVSEAVKRFLVNNQGISVDLIDVIPGFADFSNFNPQPMLKKKLNLPAKSIVVGGCGEDFWRKGKDLFLQIAIIVGRKCPDIPIYFVWLGGTSELNENFQLRQDIAKAGMGDTVILLDSVPNPIDYFADFDIFLMASREDPYPVVNLEIAALSIPILCFDNSGGSPEFVEDDAGFVVPYLDVESMAEKVILMAQDKKLRTRLGGRAREKVIRRHDINVAAPKIMNVIRKFI